MSGRIGQLFINDDKITTYLCLNNHLSFLSPEEGKELSVNVQLHNEKGDIVVEKTVHLANRGALSLSVSELLQGIPCRVGMASCDTGVGNTHFFTYYLNNESQAMAIIHPQSAMGQSEKGKAWRSCQSIVTDKLQSLKVFHANHSIHPATIRYTLRDFYEKTVVDERMLQVEGASAGFVEFDIVRLSACPSLVSLETDTLPSPNGKALLMREYSNGRYSMSHG
ncbi:MAG: hypothetical protein KDD70_07410 [Bdellovibrionales bacterium]|nr:hypothetical protein [Bdellovibrionales bacterium]